MGKKSRSKAKQLHSSSFAKSSCSSCFAPIRNEAKRETCDGCSSELCWRCAKKYLQSCPNNKNGRGCIRPMLKRCNECATGATLRRLYHKTHGTDIDPQCFSDYAHSFEVSRQPVLYCDSPGCDATSECAFCFHSNTKTIMHCVSCRKVRCTNCTRKSMDSALFAAALGETDYMARCRTCSGVYCLNCITIPHLLRGDGFTCQRCYYSKKACTNPACPNEIGVQTLRCSDCRRSRYCSKECQVIMYPKHQARCRRIMTNKAERDAEVEATRSLMHKVANACKSAQTMAESEPEKAAAFKEQSKGIVSGLEAACKLRPLLPKEEREKALFIIEKAQKLQESDEVSEDELDGVMELLCKYLGGHNLAEEMARGV